MEKNNEIQSIGSRLSICRQNKNMTQEELANRLGITPQALSKWERGISLPDTAMLPEVARMLEISTDYLLGVSSVAASGNGDSEMQRAIGRNLRNALEPLELVIGKELIPLFTDEKFVGEIKNLRLRLSGEGILLPVVRIRDDLRLDEREFMLLAYQNVIYSERLVNVDGETLHYMIEKFGDCIREKYYEILSPELIKELLDNLKIKYPVLIEEVIPKRISYGALTDVAKRVLRRGCAAACLPKMIEIMDSVLRWQKEVSLEELENAIVRELKREDNFLNVINPIS